MDEVQASSPVTGALHIERGLCYVMFAYDAARSIDLEQAEKRIHETSERQTIRHKRRTPNYFEYQPPPLRVSYGSAAVHIEACLARPNVDLILYDFGAVAALYSLPIVGPFDELMRLSEELYDNPFLLSDSRKRVEELLKVLGDAATHANLATVVEDYVIFHVESLSGPLDISKFLASHYRQIAQILRAESRTLSAWIEVEGDGMQQRSGIFVLRYERAGNAQTIGADQHQQHALGATEMRGFVDQRRVQRVAVAKCLQAQAGVDQAFNEPAGRRAIASAH